MNKNRKTIIVICISFILTCILSYIIIWGYPTFYENQCKNRVYTELEQKVNDDVRSANIRIAIGLTQTAGNVTSYNYGEIGCGVIFEHEDGFYYALTASHVVDGMTKLEKEVALESDDETPVSRELYMIPYGTATYDQIRSKSKTHIPMEDFYTQFSVIDVMYISSTTDLAIIRFQSDENYGCLTLADEDPVKGEQIVLFGKDSETGSVINYGKIISSKYETFDANDDRLADQVLKHNAYEKAGYSGGAALNKQMKIVGIDIGGGTDIFKKFRYGAMIPINIVKEAVQEWKEQ